MSTSAVAMNSTCNSEFSCSNFWLPGYSNPPLNVHNQINTMELLNALIVIENQSSGSDKINPPRPPSSNSGIGNFGIKKTISLILSALLIL